MNETDRHYTWIDSMIMHMDNALKSHAAKDESLRSSPAQHLPKDNLTDKKRRHAAGLMRINHVGEVCAQALYQGQAMTAQDSGVRETLQRAAQEERDHLHWCEKRLYELGSFTSYLNPVWYTGAFFMGSVAGFVGDRFSLGFVQETEYQVVQHLESHLKILPLEDFKSREILQHMRQDELAHATSAKNAGATELPALVKFAMRCCAKVMTTLAYWV